MTDTLPAARRFIRVATSPGPPTITGAPPAITRTPTPTFTWSGGRVSSRWSILNPAGTPVQTGEVPTAAGQVVPAPLPDGSYQFRVAQRNLVGVEGPPASYGFSIDTAAPGALTLRRSTAQRDSRNTPRYSWGGLEPGAVVTWRVLRASGALVQGPASVAAGDVTPSRLASGSYVFEARQTDLAGNSGPPATDAFVVLPRLAPGIRLPMRNVRRLTPPGGRHAAQRAPHAALAVGSAGPDLQRPGLPGRRRREAAQGGLGLPPPAPLRGAAQEGPGAGRVLRLARLALPRGAAPEGAGGRQPLLRAPGLTPHPGRTDWTDGGQGGARPRGPAANRIAGAT